MFKKILNWLLAKYNNFINPECYYMFTATYKNQNIAETGTFYIKSRVLPSIKEMRFFVASQIEYAIDIFVTPPVIISEKNYKRFQK